MFYNFENDSQGKLVSPHSYEKIGLKICHFHVFLVNFLVNFHSQS